MRSRNLVSFFCFPLLKMVRMQQKKTWYLADEIELEEPEASVGIEKNL